MAPSVVVVGGGVSGLSTALNLLELGARDVVLLETNQLGSGSSGLSVGVIETQYLDQIDIVMRVWSKQFFLMLERDYGLELTRNGYLRLAHSAAQVTAFVHSVELQSRAGIADARVLDQADIQRVVPDLKVDDLAAGLYGPSDGYIDAHTYCQLLGRLIREAGGEVLTEAKLVGHDLLHSGRHGLTTTAGNLECDYVVNAAGAWAAEVANLLGTTARVLPQRHHVMLVELPRTLSYMMPEVMDYEPRSGTKGLYFRHEGFDHLLAGLHSEEPLEGVVDPNTYDRSIGFDYITELSEGLERRLPGLEGARLGSGWTGLYPVSPDSYPQIGPTDNSATVIAAYGVGGSGIQISPIVGRLAAEWILFGEPRTIHEALSLVPTRFESSGDATTVQSSS